MATGRTPDHPPITVRRCMTQLEEIHHEFGPGRQQPIRRAAIAAVIENPFAGGYVEEIAFFMEPLASLGTMLAEQLLGHMGLPPSAIESYGKGAIVGSAGELEHGALWHVPGGHAMRHLLSDHGVSTNAIVPSSKKVGAPSTRMDIPLTHVNASYVRSHFDAIEVAVPGAPAADELVLVLALASGGRVHARVGGLRKDDIVGENGLV